MRATVSAAEPDIAREAKLGDLFISHMPGMQECVFAVNDQIVLFPLTLAECIRATVIACRVAPHEPGHRQTGTSVPLPIDSPITFVEPIEPVAFRERKPRSHG